MDKITIDLNILKENDLNIDEYLTLYSLAFPDVIAETFSPKDESRISLEKKGFIKITLNGIILRESTRILFNIGKKDYFLEWLNKYPIRARTSRGGTRVLSPKSDETIEGKKLRKKWESMFKGDPYEEMKAIAVLEAEVAMRIKSNDLEFMVEAPRWLNGGYHEKMEYLLEEKNDSINGIVTDYEEDWN